MLSSRFLIAVRPETAVYELPVAKQGVVVPLRDWHADCQGRCERGAVVVHKR